MIINVASKELCAKLKKLSGWSDTIFCWNGQIIPSFWPEEMRAHEVSSFPAYDLGYLMRKLPHDSISITCAGEAREWRAGHLGISQYADTPEDAACKLAIELLKAKVIDKKAKL